MSSKERTIRKFNPGTFQSDEEVMQQFVVRRRELDAALETVRDNIDAASCQHLLVVAPRGRGKTMLLARVAAELRANPEYHAKLLPVRFMEESHEVLDIGDFWLDALYYLARECASAPPGLASAAPGLARELEGVHASLAEEWRDPRLHYRARAAVLNAADRLGKQLVLMVENLQALCDDVDDGFEWELRESLQVEPKVMLLGTATSRFSALDDPQGAFFELFRVVGLSPLDTKECMRLWEAVTGDRVKPNEMRPLEILTGGSPRLLVIVADFARHRSFRQLLEELVTLVDDHTEYFRGHLSALPKTERRIYLASLDLWRPSSTSEIAARARMGVRITSSMLGRLVDRGALTVEGGARSRRYAATERLYCIYYKIRRERDEAAVVQNLIRFMALYYQGRRSAGELRQALADEVAHDSDVLAGMARALREDSSVGLLAPEAAVVAYDSVIQHHSETTSGGGLEELASAMMNRVAMLFAASKDRDAVVAHDKLIAKFGDSNVPEIMGTVASAFFNLGLAKRWLGQPAEAISAYEEVETRYGEVASVGVQEAVIQARSNKAEILSDNESQVADAMAIYGDIAFRVGEGGVQQLQRHRARALVNMGSVQARLGRLELAIGTWKGMAGEFADWDETVIQQDVARALGRIGAAQLATGSTESALRTSEEVMDRYGRSSDGEIRKVLALSLTVRSDALEKLGRTTEALGAYRELQDNFGDVVEPSGVSVEWSAILGQTRLHCEQGNVDAARRSLRALYAATDAESGQNVTDMYAWLAVFAAGGVFSPAELAGLLSSNPKKLETFWPFEVALRQMAGETVRAPIQVMEVADDLLEEMETLKTAVEQLRESGTAPEPVRRSLLGTLPRLAHDARHLARPTGSP